LQLRVTAAPTPPRASRNDALGDARQQLDAGAAAAASAPGTARARSSTRDAAAARAASAMVVVVVALDGAPTEEGEQPARRARARVAVHVLETLAVVAETGRGTRVAARARRPRALRRRRGASARRGRRAGLEAPRVEHEKLGRRAAAPAIEGERLRRTARRGRVAPPNPGRHTRVR